MPRQYLLSVALVAAALVLRWMLEPLLQGRGPFVLVYSALLMLVVLVRPGPFLMGGLLGTLGSWYFFILPRSHFQLNATASMLLIGLFAVAILAAGATAWMAGRLQDEAQQARTLAETQREALRVTLASIGDAVITTGVDGRITFLNDVARELTGWPGELALGCPLPDVFRLINEETRLPVANPVDKVLKLGRIMGLANHTLLVRRDGSERPIDDSAAPIRDSAGRITGVVLVFSDVTARRAAEQATQRSVRELSEFFEHASIGLQWISPQGRILRANQAQLHLLGWPREAYVGRLLEEFAASGHEVRKLLDRLARGEATHEHPVQMRRKDGSLRDVLVGCNALHHGGQYVHARFFMLDVTERNRVEQSLRESEQRFRLMADTTPVLIWMTDTERRCTWFNRTWLEFVGRGMAQELGRGWLENVHPDDREHCVRAFEQAAAQRRGYTMDYRLRRADGEYRWLVDNGTPRFDPDGSFAGYIGSCIDITERKRVEAELARSETKFRRMADANLIGVGFGDLQGNLSEVNDEMLRMMGCTRGEHEAHPVNWIARLAPEHAAAHAGWGERLRVYGSFAGYENAFLQPDGQRMPFVGAAALLEPGGDTHVSIALDLTQLKQAEHARAQLVAQLRDADRRKDEFLATLAHELRNPLAPVMHGVEVMKRGDAEPRQLEIACNIVERQVMHMVRLIDDLMDVSRITRDKLELRRTQVDLHEVLDQAIEVCRPDLLASRQELMVRVPAEPVVMRADPVRLIQVFSNLLGNANHYSEPGGLICLTTQLQGEQVLVSVKDCGMGIAPEMLPRIFDLFAQGAQTPVGAGRGLGVGLTLAKRLVEMHGGEVQALSEGEGLGSEFIVRLPLDAGTAEEPAAPAERVERVEPMVPVVPVVPPATTYRILIVDDNADAAHTLDMLLRLAGHHTCIAHDGMAALEVAADYRPDAALLDIGLPQLSGLEVATRLRQEAWAQGLVLVAVTGWGQQADRIASQKAGFDAHLVKPVDYTTLLSVLGALMDRNSSRNPATPAA